MSIIDENGIYYIMSLTDSLFYINQTLISQNPDEKDLETYSKVTF